MFCIGDVVYYKASKGARKERCKVIGVEYHDKSFNIRYNIFNKVK